MRCADYIAIGLIGCAAGSLCQAQPSAYIERWATGTLTTGEPFESWRIHVVVPDGDDWMVSGIEGWLNGGPTWYYHGGALRPPDPDQFPDDPDLEFKTYWTPPHLYPNTDLVQSVAGNTGEVLQPTYLNWEWFDTTYDTDGDFVVWQGAVLNPLPGEYGVIDFQYGTLVSGGTLSSFSFVIPEPATAALLALGACFCLRRRRL